MCSFNYGTTTRLSVSRLPVSHLTVNCLPVSRLTVNCLPVSRLTVNCLPVSRLTVSRLPVSVVVTQAGAVENIQDFRIHGDREREGGRDVDEGKGWFEREVRKQETGDLLG